MVVRKRSISAAPSGTPSAAARGALGSGPGGRRPAGRGGPPFRSPGRVLRNHSVDQRCARRREADLPASRLHPGQREPPPQLRKRPDRPELVPPPLTAGPASAPKAITDSDLRQSVVVTTQSL